MPRIPLTAPLLALLLAPVPAFGAGEPASALLWPTDAGRCVTSSFCEFRSGHFHSGIDISTGGKVGFRCFAVGGGEIVRARVSCQGYGRALYLRLDDGRTAVYAHLAGFAGDLADTVRALQESQGTAYLDLQFPPGTFRVSRGEVIGFTGQSGAGVPHLHLELRDALERPMDPLRHGLTVPDRTPIVPVRMAFTPLEAGSNVDGGTATALRPVSGPGPGGRYRVEGTVTAQGSIGLSVEVDETTDVCRYRLAPSRVQVREDGLTLYAMDYERFPFSQTGLQDLQIDPRYTETRSGHFHNLWSRPGNVLPFRTADSATDGVLRGEPRGETRRDLEIVLLDSAGNRSVVDVQLSFAPPPEVTVLDARLEAAPDPEAAADTGSWSGRGGEASVVVEGAVRGAGRAVGGVEIALSTDAGETWRPAERIPAEQGLFRATIAVPSRPPGEGVGPLVVRARAVDAEGVTGVPRSVGVDGAPVPLLPAPEFEVAPMGPWFELRLPAGAGWNHLESTSGALVLPADWGVRIAVARPAWSGADLRWGGEGAAGSAYDPWGRPVEIAFAAPPRVEEGSVLESGPLATYRFPPGSLGEAAYASLRTEKAEGKPGLRPLGPLHFLDLGHVPYSDEFRITLRPEPGAAYDERRLGIFVLDRGGLRYIGTTRDQGWTAQSRTRFGIGLFEDTAPPVIERLHLEFRDGRTQLIFRAADRESGLGCDDVEVFLDGQPILHELDDETGEVVAYPPLDARSGVSGAFEVRAVDRCGNAASRVETVTFP